VDCRLSTDFHTTSAIVASILRKKNVPPISTAITAAVEAAGMRLASRGDGTDGMTMQPKGGSSTVPIKHN